MIPETYELKVGLFGRIRLYIDDKPSADGPGQAPRRMRRATKQEVHTFITTISPQCQTADIEHELTRRGLHIDIKA